MISFVQPLAVGDALRVYLRPPPGVKRWRLLRKDADTFTGHDDAQALLVHDGQELVVTDVAGLYNGAQVFYRAYYLQAGQWMASASAQGSASATFSDLSADVMTLVRNRLELGLQQYVNRGQLVHELGRIPVMTASPLVEETPLPVVTVHVSNDSSQERFVGDVVTPDFQDDDEDWHTTEGWLSRWQLTIVAWSLNADERATLRKAIKAVLMANMTVFDAAGMAQVDLQLSDTEDFQSYSAPIYMANCNLTCLAPSVVDGVDPPIRVVDVDVRFT